jgi:phosphoribosyl-ATP pyrophosphohydrolase/phosphoribosyl-AMP cyclohydrolase
VTHESWLERVQFDPDGLVPVVVQDSRNGDVLMVAWATREALTATRATGQAHFWSRSRRALWQKGESSGHVQQIEQIRLDCDGDTVLYRVTPAGPACHTGQPTCFSSAVRADGGLEDGPDPGGHLLSRLAAMVRDRQPPARPSRTRFPCSNEASPHREEGGEEAVEVVVAATTEDDARLAAGPRISCITCSSC